MKYVIIFLLMACGLQAQTFWEPIENQSIESLADTTPTEVYVGDGIGDYEFWQPVHTSLQPVHTGLDTSKVIVLAPAQPSTHMYFDPNLADVVYYYAYKICTFSYGQASCSYQKKNGEPLKHVFDSWRYNW